MNFDLPNKDEIKEIFKQSFKEVFKESLPTLIRETSRKEWVNPEELEEIAGISIRSQQYLRSKKRIPYHKEGRKVLYNMEEIEAHFKENKIEPRS